MSFGSDLRRFARAADDVNDDVIREVRTLVGEYVDRGLAVKHVAIMREASVNNDRGLTVQGDPGRNVDPSFSIRDADDNYTRQVACAYDRGQPMWVLAADRGSLEEADGYVDEWSQVDHLPAYTSSVEGLYAKTSIMLPLRSDNKKIGVMSLDSVEAVEKADAATSELELIAEALAVLYSNYDATSDARRLTKSAIGELQQLMPDPPHLRVPHVFVSSSSDADESVIEVITRVLGREESSGRLTWKHWPDNHDAGPVMSSLVEDIRKAEFGICYLSEPADDADARFRDNLNVLFEAGMFHVLGGGGGWIPVREPEPPSPPFNLNDLNTVIVPRTDEGGLDDRALDEELSRFVDGQIDK